MSSSEALPARIQVQVIAKAGDPLTNCRKGWDPMDFQFTVEDGYLALKGVIERRINQLLPGVMRNGVTVYEHITEHSNRRTTVMLVKRWQHSDGLYFEGINSGGQRGYVLIDSEDRFRQGS